RCNVLGGNEWGEGTSAAVSRHAWLGKNCNVVFFLWHSNRRACSAYFVVPFFSENQRPHVTNKILRGIFTTHSSAFSSLAERFSMPIGSSSNRRPFVLASVLRRASVERVLMSLRVMMPTTTFFLFTMRT